MSEHVRVERDGGVLAITLARPERRNAITVAMYSALAAAIEQAAGDPEIRVITIRGEGQDFTAGNDLRDFMTALPRNGEDVPVLRFLRAIAANRIPLIAAVQGNAVGIGTTMLFHCDLVIAAADARFSMPFVDLGLVPEAASSLLLPRLAGRRRAAQYLLLGEAFGPLEAREIGLVSQIVDAGESERALAELVAKLLAKPPEALRLTQELLRAAGDDGILERMQLESRHFSDRLQSNEVRSAIEAFFASRAS
jgi:enoyl-CoA hydratase/carnithine racemase